MLATGTNHVRPTGRAARYSGGLPALRFLKTLTYQRIDEPEASREVAEAVAKISAAEALPAHGATATRRLARLTAQGSAAGRSASGPGAGSG
jgi:sulfopropanediol 3-dehydrogenase